MLSVVVLVLAAPANTLTIGPEFAGFDSTFTQKTDADLGKKGMNDCGFRETTKLPVLTFEVTRAPTDLVLELAETRAGAVLTLGPKHLCLEPGITTIDSAGTYSLYLLDGPSQPGSVSARVRLFSRSQMSRQIARSVTRLELSGTGPNPLVVRSVGGATSFDPATVTARCASVRVSPLAELTVRAESRYEFDAPDRELFLVSPSGCAAVGEDAVELAPGSYALWMEASAESIDVSIRDTERSMKLEGSASGASAVRITQLPMVVRAKVTQDREERDESSCEVRGRKPALQFDPGTSFETVHVWATGGVTRVTFDVIGDDVRECNQQRLRLVKPKKAYLFIEGEKSGETVVAFTDGKAIPPFWSSSMPDAAAPVAERVLSYAYPFWAHPDFSLPPAPPMFAKAPASLFVFLNKDQKDVPTTEPLLLLAFDGKSATALRVNGEKVPVRAAVLTTAVPATITMPALRPPPPAATTDEAWANASPLDEARVNAWVKRQNEYLGCVATFMEKNDPAYGRSYELIYVRSGVNVSDVVYASARAACGEARFKKDGEAFIKAINASQATLLSTIGSTLAKKLGR